MPVQKFRRVEDMPRPIRIEGPMLVEHIRALWNRAFLLSPPVFPRGVARFASMDLANEARAHLVHERMRATAVPPKRT
jgi:hypothetical protein